MHGGVKKYLKTSYFQDIFDFFIKYVGSSAYRAPAFMNCLPTIQFRYDLWYVMGGMYGLAQGLERLMRELGIEINLKAEVSRIRLSPDGSSARGIVLADGTAIEADHVVSNMEVVPTYQRLLPEDPAFVRKLEKRLEPTCSGLVIDIGLDRKYPQLAHHNFIFSRNQKRHFKTVFQKKTIPEDPTLYLVAASRTDPAVAPEGCDCLKILPHIPHLDPANPVAARGLRCAEGTDLRQARTDRSDGSAQAHRERTFLDPGGHRRAILFESRLDLRGRLRSFPQLRLQGTQGQPEIPESLFRGRVG